MSNDRYERIRRALAMGPTHGPWHATKPEPHGTEVRGPAQVSLAWCGGATTVGEEGCYSIGAAEAAANAHFIAACDPDTIRELLEERDELAKLVAEMRGTLRDLRIHLHAAGRRPEECYEMSMIDDALHLATIDQARGKGEP
jgi:hypothetical protein